MLLLVSGAALFLDQRQELGRGANGLLDILDLKASKFSPSTLSGWCSWCDLESISKARKLASIIVWRFSTRCWRLLSMVPSPACRLNTCQNHEMSHVFGHCAFLNFLSWPFNVQHTADLNLFLLSCHQLFISLLLFGHLCLCQTHSKLPMSVKYLNPKVTACHCRL